MTTYTRVVDVHVNHKKEEITLFLKQFDVTFPSQNQVIHPNPPHIFNFVLF